MTSSSGPFHRGNLRQRLYCLFLFSPGTCPPASPPSVLLTWFHDLPLLGDIIDFSLNSPLCAWEYFHLSGALSLTVCSSFLPPSCFWEALSVALVSATLPSLFIHGLAGPISSDAPLLLSGFLLSQLLGMLVWLPWPRTGSTCLLSSPTLMRTPLLSCWQCIPAKAQQAKATDCPVKRGSCLFLPAPLFRETTRKKKFFLPFLSNLTH